MPSLPNISPELLKAYQEEIERRTSGATAKRKMSALRRFFSWAQKKGHIEKDPSQVTTQATFQPLELQQPKQEEQRVQKPTPSKDVKQARQWLTPANAARGGILVALVVLILLLVGRVELPIPFRKTPATDQGPVTDTPNQQPTVLSPWTLYARMKLTQQDGSPVVGSQSVVFKLYQNENDTSPLHTFSAKEVTTDSEGNTLITIDEVPTELFFENEKLYLGGEIDGSELSTRLPVSTANQAANLQGFFPAQEAGANTIPVLSSDGSLLLAAEAPSIKATSGNLLVEGNTLTLSTPNTSDGDITINPDGSGTANFIFEGFGGNLLNTKASNLTTGSLYSGVVANNQTGYNLITLQSGSDPTTKFSVDALGNTYIGADLDVEEDISTGGETRLTSEGRLENITGYEQESGNFSITQSGGDSASISKENVTALSDLLTLTLDERGKPETSDSIYSTLVLKRYDGAVEAMALHVDEGNATFDAQLRLGRFSSDPTNPIGTGSVYYNTTDNKVYYWNGSAWVEVGSGSSTSFTNISSGTNTTATMVVGSGASLDYTGTGTINASSLENLTASQFLRSDTSDNYTSGTLTFDSGTTLDVNGDLSVADTNIAFDGASTTFTFTGAATLSSSSVTVSDAFSVNGNTTLGDATSDTITFTGRADSNLVPSTTDTYDLGSASLIWNALYTDQVCFDGSSDCITESDAAGPWTLASPHLFPDATNYQVGIGTTTTADIISQLYVTRDLTDGTLGKALAIFNQTENEDIITASASGTPRLTVTNGGDLQFHQASSITTTTGDLTLDSAGTLVVADDISWTATTPNLSITDGETITVTDGTNTLLSLADNGTTGDLIVTGDVAVNGGDITSTQTTFNFVNSTVTTLNIGGAATTLELGATSGTTSVNNDLSVDGNTTLGDATSDTITFTGRAASDLLPSTDNTYDLGSAALQWAEIRGVTIYQNSNQVCDTSGNCTTGDEGPWAETSGVVHLDTSSWQVAIGDTTTEHKLEVEGAVTGKALVSLWEKGDQDILVASNSATPTNVFRVTNSGNLYITGTLNTTSGNLTIDSAGGQTTVSDNLVVTGTSDLQGAVSNSTGNLNLNDDVDISGDLAVNGGDITSTQTTFNFVNSTVTTLNIGGAATTLEVGATSGTTSINNNLAIDGNTTIGDASGDSVTANASTWTFVNDTNFVLSGGVNGLSFDTDTFSVDATNNLIGIGTTSPVGKLHLTGAVTGKALAIFDETGDQNVFTASASGTTVANLTRTGDLELKGQGDIRLFDSDNSNYTGFQAPSLTTNLLMTLPGDSGSNGYVLQTDGSGTLTWADITTGGSEGPWTLTDPHVYPDLSDYQVGVGTTTTADIISSFYVTRTLADGALGKAVAIFNQTENEDILSASASGTPRLTVTNSGDLQFHQASSITTTTGDLDINPAGGDLTIQSRAIVGSGTAGVGKFTATGAEVGKALAIFNETGDQNIITASASGTTRMNLTNAGQLELLTDGSTAGLTVGAGEDLALYHDGANTFIVNSTGNLQVQNTDGANVNFTDGTNTLAAIKDQGAYVFWNLLGKSTTGDPASCAEGDIYYNASDDTIKICHSGNTWEALDGGAGGASGQWTLNETDGTLYPNNNTVDVLIGGTATSSAKFTFLNVAQSRGSQVASMSADLVLDKAASIQTTNNQALTIGGSTTGNITLSPLNGSGIITASGNVDATSGVDVTGANLTVGGSNFSVSNTTGNITSSGVIDINGGGTSDIAGTLNLSGNNLQSSGDLTINAGGGQIIFSDTDTLNVGGLTGVAYNAFANSGEAPEESAISSDNDLYVGGDVEIDGSLYASGNGTIGGFTSGSVIFADSSGNLSEDNTSFFFDNTDKKLGIGTNSPTGKFHVSGAVTGKALAILDETGDQAIFSASASGTPKLTILNSGNLQFHQASSITTTTGDITFDPAGADVIFSDTTTLNIGGSGSEVAYNAIADSVAGASANMTSDNDLYIEGNLEVDGNIYDASGNVVAGYWTLSGNDLFATSTDYKVGIGTSSPTSRLHVATNTTTLTGKAAFIVDQLESEDILSASASGTTRMTLTNSGTLKLFNASSTISNTSGDITIDAASGTISFAGDNLTNIGTVTAGTGIFTSVIQVAGSSAVSYSRFGTNTTGHSGNLTAGEDVLISGDLELDANFYLDGGTIANSAGTATITFTSTPTTGENTLSASSWLVENTANVGKAALMVNQTKGGDLFTASASGTPRFTITNAGNIDTSNQTVDWTLNAAADALNFDSNTLSIDASSDRVGIGTAAPGQKLEVSSGNIRLNGSTGNWIGFQSGNALTWDSSNGPFMNSTANYVVNLDSDNNDADTRYFAINKNANTFTGGTEIFRVNEDTSGGIAGAFNAGSTSTVAYSRFGTATTGHGLGAANDVLIGDALEVDGVLYLDGGNISNSAGTATVLFTATPTTSRNTLSASSWLIENTANVGEAALMVNQQKGGSIISASASGTTRFTVGNDGATTIDGTASTLLTVGGGSGKIDVGTVDPVYTIGDGKYATYMAGMIGVKEETTGSVRTTEYVPGYGYRQVIDFTKQEKGSDLWLFSKATDLEKHIRDMVVLLSPSDNTRAWYTVDPNNYSLSIYTSRPTSVSYRLTAPRFDADLWTNYNTNPDSVGFILEDNPLTVKEDGEIKEAEDNYIANLEVTESENTNDDFFDSEILSVFDLRDEAGNAIHEIGQASKFVAANIKAGAIETSQIAVKGSAYVTGTIKAGAVETGKITTDSFFAFQGTVDNLLVTSGLVSPYIETSTISPIADSDVTVSLDNSEEKDGSSYGRFVIEGEEEKEVATIDSQGNATFSGTVESEDVKTNEITASKIYADEIISRSGKFGEISSATSSAVTLEEIERLLKEAEVDQKVLASTTDTNIYTATNSATLDEIAATDLYVTNQAAINALSVSETVVIGNDFSIQVTKDELGLAKATSINSLSAPLEIQSLALAPVDIMAGLVRIDTNGDVSIEGNLYVAGNIDSQGLTIRHDDSDPESATNSGFFKLLDSQGQEIAGINASGSANFSQVATDKLVIAGSEATTSASLLDGLVTETNATAGTARIPSGTRDITIRSPKITNDTLVYVTPTSSTLNNVLYVKRKGEGFFVTGFNSSLDVDVEFNWWVIDVTNPISSTEVSN